ncbi:MAG: Plasmid stabilization system protein [Tardiphaga sp.]|nr:Plasmid stabilization system protein [Tardiphaga sp.]
MSNSPTRRPRARKDLLEIWLYIATDNETAANALLKRIEHAIQMLLLNPESGRRRPDLAPDLRSFPVGNYVVFYSRTAGHLEIIRVLHTRQDILPDDLR